MSYKKEKTLSFGEQSASVKVLFPHFTTTLHPSFMTVTGKIQPAPGCNTYQFRVKYQLNKAPDITIVDPPLKPNFKGEGVPHVYQGLKLCLYKPGYGEFTSGKLLSKTIIVWISTWLYFYEIWHITGDWLGGGEHPKTNNRRLERSFRYGSVSIST
jgi:hypothetical protein